MPLSFDGAGTITGLQVGGLPDGTVDQDSLAAGVPSSIATSALPSGTILQVLQYTKTDTYSTASSNTWLDIPTLSGTITPSSTSNKILVFGYLNDSNTANFTMHKLVRGTTDVFLGDAAGSRLRVTAGAMTDANRLRTTNFVYLDSPSTTDETNYKIQMRVNSGETGYINRSSSDNDNVPYHRSASAIILMEVAG